MSSASICHSEFNFSVRPLIDENGPNNKIYFIMGIGNRSGSDINISISDIISTIQVSGACLAGSRGKREVSSDFRQRYSG